MQENISDQIKRSHFLLQDMSTLLSASVLSRPLSQVFSLRGS